MSLVLIADDKAENREFLVTLLGYRGHRFLEAVDGAEALEQARRGNPDLVIADVLMPVMDGYEFVRQLRNDPLISKTPVIFYTASYHEQEVRSLARSCGVRHVIIKPTEPEEILAVVSDALGVPQEPLAVPPPTEFDRDHLRLLTDKLSANVNALEAANQRLAELLEVSRLLSSEHDGRRLLEKFCPAARELLGGRFAFVGVFSRGAHPGEERPNEPMLKPLFASGLGLQPPDCGSQWGARGVLARLAEEGGPLRVPDVDLDPLSEGLPTPYMGPRSFLGARLSTGDRVYGLVWVVEKLGAAEFSQEDEGVLRSLAAQASVAYENALRYDESQRHNEELEQRVRQRTGELSDANKELEAFTYSVSHDLRSPLRHIAGYAQILLSDLGEQVTPECREHAQAILASALRMTALVNDLLSLSQAGRQGLRRERTDLQVLVGKVMRELEPETQGRAIEWRMGALPRADCDPVLMRQVFMNLLSNAIKYTRPRARAVIEIGVLEGEIATIFVRDNGVGFDMRYADKLFGVFQRLHLQEEFEGTGAGLAIVLRIIHRHNGRVWAESALGQGATFYFTLGPA